METEDLKLTPTLRYIPHPQQSQRHPQTKIMAIMAIITSTGPFGTLRAPAQSSAVGPTILDEPSGAPIEHPCSNSDARVLGWSPRLYLAMRLSYHFQPLPGTYMLVMLCVPSAETGRKNERKILIKLTEV